MRLERSGGRGAGAAWRLPVKGAMCVMGASVAGVCGTGDMKFKGQVLADRDVHAECQAACEAATRRAAERMARGM